MSPSYRSGTVSLTDNNDFFLMMATQVRPRKRASPDAYIEPTD